VSVVAVQEATQKPTRRVVQPIDMMVKARTK
jgi:hypothetical protein